MFDLSTISAKTSQLNETVYKYVINKCILPQIYITESLSNKTTLQTLHSPKCLPMLLWLPEGH